MTAQLPSWVTADIDLRTPSVARVYDFLLGGMHNFAVDREMGRRLEREVPGMTHAAWANRAFCGVPSDTSQVWGSTALEAAALTGSPALHRKPIELLALLGDFVPVPPGVVAMHAWRPDEGPHTGVTRSPGYAVVGRKP